MERRPIDDDLFFRFRNAVEVDETDAFLHLSSSDRMYYYYAKMTTVSAHTSFGVKKIIKGRDDGTGANSRFHVASFLLALRILGRCCYIMGL